VTADDRPARDREERPRNSTPPEAATPVLAGRGSGSGTFARTPIAGEAAIVQITIPRWLRLGGMSFDPHSGKDYDLAGSWRAWRRSPG
jgi:hypothetical protein